MRFLRPAILSALVLGALLSQRGPTTPGLALTVGTTELVSVDSVGNQTVGGASSFPSISNDRRFVAFYSAATNLVAGDTNGTSDVFVRDRETGLTERVSVDSAGNQANGSSVYNGLYPTISGDGRFVVFFSDSTNLVQGDTNARWDVFVRDRQTGTTERVSVDSAGNQSNGSSYVIREAISADGRFVVFESVATNLVTGDTTGSPGWDVFVRDRQTGTTERVSVDSAGNRADASSLVSSISAGGRYVTFTSAATNLVPGDTNGVSDVFVHDRQTGDTERVSVESAGGQGDGRADVEPWISADGRFVAFGSWATNLVPDDTNGVLDVFVHDRQTHATERVSVASDETQANGHAVNPYPAVSEDGRYVTFTSDATNLVAGDTNGKYDIFLRDRQAGVTERLSLDSAGNEANDRSANGMISADGRFAAFASFATNLVPGDTNGLGDVFVRDRCPDGSCVTPPSNHKVLFVDGIGSSSHCNNKNDDGGPNMWVSTILLRQHLLGFGSGYEWLAAFTELDATDDFLFYEYSDTAEPPDGCAGSSSPNYRNRESCWSLNDTYGYEGPVPSGGQGRRFATFVKDYLDHHQDTVLSIIGFSQGGVLATYAIDEGLIPSAYRSRIRTIITLDSPFGIFKTAAADAVAWFNHCPGDSLYDSAHDFREESDVIRNIKDHRPPPGSTPRPPLYTVNEEPGTGFCIGDAACLGVVSDSLSQVTRWQSGHLTVRAANHGDSLKSLFTPPADEKKFLLFVACALSGRSGCRGATEDLISLSPTVELPAGATKEIFPGASTWGVNTNSQVVPGGGGLAPQVAALSTTASLSTSNFTTTLIDPNGVSYTGASLPAATLYQSGNGYESFTISDPLPGTWTIQVSTTDPLGATVDVWQTTELSALVDGDGDGVANDSDNCPVAANPSQVDTDGDALGDECDDDLDDDTITNDVDDCLFVANPGQADVDADGLGDACDSDSDNDLLDDDAEVSAGTNPMNPDSDGDGKADGAELYFAGTDPLNPDTDGDGISDGLLAVAGPPAVAAGPDNCPVVANSDQTDADLDGVGDICDNCPSSSNADQADFDADSLGDPCDPDDDNDLTPDPVESACGSDSLLAASIPERVDGVFADVDDDGDTQVDEALPPSAGAYDCDGDGFTGAAEAYVFSSTPGDTSRDQTRCAATSTAGDEDPDAWPTDNNDDQWTSLGDVLRYIPVFNSFGPGPPYDRRYDLNASNGITLADVLRFIPFINQSCAP